MEYTIGSFNLNKLNFRSDKDIKKNFQQIAGIIASERFDVVALQEVVSEGAVKLLVDCLGSLYWDYCFPPRYIGHPEYAFIWNKCKLKLVESDNNPRIYDTYHSGREGQTKLIYPPLVARFSPQDLLGGSNFEIRLINTHISFSKNAFDSENDFTSCSKVEHRKCELRTLTQQIYRSYSTHPFGNHLPAYTILLGDYNLCIGSSNSCLDEEIEIASGRIVKTVQAEKTTLKRNIPENPVSINDYYSMNYDHFSYEVSLLKKLRLEDSRVEALGSYYDIDLAAYHREISDHVPIKLVLDLRTH